MRKRAVKVEPAERNFAGCADRARDHADPRPEKVCLGRDLVDALSRASLSDEEAKAWRRDLQAARKTLKAPSN